MTLNQYRRAAIHGAILAAALATVLTSAPPASAAEIDFTTPLVQLDGKPFLGPDGKPVETTLASVAETALLGSYVDEQNLTGEEKVKRFSLANKIHGNRAASLTTEEVALIKRLIAKSYNPLVVGLSWTILDPASVPK